MGINNTLGVQTRSSSVDLTSGTTTGANGQNLNVAGVHSSATQPETGTTDGNRSSGMRARISRFFQRLCSCFTCYRSRRPSASANNTPVGTVNGAFEGDSDDNAGAAGSNSRTQSSSGATSQPGAARNSLNDMAGSTSDGAGASTDAPTSPSSAKPSTTDVKLSNWRQRGANFPHQQTTNSLASYASSSSYFSVGSGGDDSVFESPVEDATSKKHTLPSKKTQPSLSFKTKPEGKKDKKAAATANKGSRPTQGQSSRDGAGPSSQQPSAVQLEKEAKKVLKNLDKTLNKQ
ncbi:MAG: hypothetical protein ACRC9R_10185 [Enterovibrio sp.]